MIGDGYDDGDGDGDGDADGERRQLRCSEMSKGVDPKSQRVCVFYSLN